jgi:hypothetical protein
MHDITWLFLISEAFASVIAIVIVVHGMHCNYERVFNIRRVGGLRFWRFGRIGGSFYWSHNRGHRFPLIWELLALAFVVAGLAYGIEFLATVIDHKLVMVAGIPVRFLTAGVIP